MTIIDQCNDQNLIRYYIVVFSFEHVTSKEKLHLSKYRFYQRSSYFSFLGVSLDISPLCSRLIEILEQDHEFKMTFERLQEKYSSSYNEELDPYLFGFNCLLELLRSLTNIVQVQICPSCRKEELL